jgi:TRAP-type C4-dicarboxylate transport system substrate-binding protein
VRIDVGSNAYRGQPGAERSIFADVRSGRAQMGWVGSRVLDALGDRRFQPLTAPLLIDGYALEQRVVQQAGLIEPMVGSLRSLGVVGLGVLPGVMRRVLGISRPIRRPADLRGEVVGIAESGLGAQAVRALGGVPRTLGPMAPDAGLNALESQLNAIYGNLYFRHASAVTSNLALWPRPLVLIMNPSVYGRLTGEERRALRDAVPQVVPQFITFARADDAAGLQELCRARVRFVRADLPAFRAALRPVYNGLDRGQLAQIELLRRGTPSDPAPSCGGSPGAAGRQPTALDGVYGKTITPAQAHSNVPENFGTFERVFDRGRWALTQHSPKSCYWAYGRFALDGPRVTFTVTDGGGLTPTNAGAKPGESVALRWRLFRDALSLTSPDNADPGAYQRISTTPSSRYLDPACAPPAGWDR